MERYSLDSNPEAVEISRLAQEAKQKRGKEGEEKGEPLRDDYENASKNIDELKNKEVVISEADKSLVEKARKNSESFDCETSHVLFQFLREYPSFLAEKMKGKKLFNLGSGPEAFSSALTINGTLRYEEGMPIIGGSNLGFSEYIAVDLFRNESELVHNLNWALDYAKIDDENSRKNIEGKMKFEKKDILEFLLQQADKSGNIIISSVNGSLIETDGYFERVAQEAFRVIPEDGIMVTVDCPELTEEAKELFPYHYGENISGVILSKKPLPNEAIMKYYEFYVLLDKAAKKAMTVRELCQVRAKGREGGVVFDMKDEFIAKLGFKIERGNIDEFNMDEYMNDEVKITRI